MSSNGGYAAAAPPPRHCGDRFFNPPIRRQHQVLYHHHHHHHHHYPHHQQVMMLHQQQQRQLQIATAAMPEYSAGEVAEAEEKKRREDDDSALSVPRSVSPVLPVANVSNLDRLMKSVTPFVLARNLPEVSARGCRTGKVDSNSFFYLEDLWESFEKWSACGAGVPLLLNGKDPVEQYYVPYLSGIQLYIDPSKPSSQLKLSSISSSSNCEADRRGKSILDSNVEQLNVLSLGDKSVSNSPGQTVFQFLEREQPYFRRPLTDKISSLVSQFPDLAKCRSCDLLPSSWICVAWYPIYRIPLGPTLKDLDACFLTFHSLSTQSGNFPPQFHPGNTRTVQGFVDPSPRISLPVFGLASYKFKNSIVSPCGPQECEQENSLMQSADNWLQRLEVKLPDYQFFRTHSFHRR